MPKIRQKQIKLPKSADLGGLRRQLGQDSEQADVGETSTSIEDKSRRIIELVARVQELEREREQADRASGPSSADRELQQLQVELEQTRTDREQLEQRYEDMLAEKLRWEGEAEAQKEALQQQQQREQELRQTLTDAGVDEQEAARLGDYTTIYVEPDQVPRRNWDTDPISNKAISKTLEQILADGRLHQAPILCRSGYPIAGQTRMLALSKLKREQPEDYLRLFPRGVLALQNTSIDHDRDVLPFRLTSLRIQRQRRPVAGKARESSMQELYRLGVENGKYTSIRQAALELGPLFNMGLRRAQDIISGKAAKARQQDEQVRLRARSALQQLQRACQQLRGLKGFEAELADLGERMAAAMDDA